MGYDWTPWNESPGNYNLPKRQTKRTISVDTGSMWSKVRTKQPSTSLVMWISHSLCIEKLLCHEQFQGRLSWKYRKNLFIKQTSATALKADKQQCVLESDCADKPAIVKRTGMNTELDFQRERCGYSLSTMRPYQMSNRKSAELLLKL